MKATCRSQIVVVALCSFLCACLSARANVYATDIRLNGSLQLGLVVPGRPVAITFILNDTATNVSVQIYAGSNVLKTFTSAAGQVGTNTGLNTVLWDGTNDDGFAAPAGVYNLSITAAAAGYATWTNITDDGTNFAVFFPAGITVNKNTNSPYFGRVFVGNGQGGTIDFTNETGEDLGNGILKCNADGSPAEEGGFGTGGYPWSGSLFDLSPWKMDIASDDRLYVDDWSGQGQVESFDQVLSTNYFDVLRRDNYPYTQVSLSGLSVIGTGTNMRIFMADNNPLQLGGLGILSWQIASNGVIATNDTGMVDVALSTNGANLSLAPYAVALDTHENIYTVQRIDTNTLPDPTVLCFPPVLIGAPAETNSTWEIGGPNPMLLNNYGVAVDPQAIYLAVASRGYGYGTNNGDSLQDGGVSIFLAASESLVTNITQDPEGFTDQEVFDVAWDNVGNLYTAYGEDGLSQCGWRVYSPPGPNQATTVAVPFIQVYPAITPPQLTEAWVGTGQLNFTLLGQSNLTYVIQQSPDLIHWAPVSTNFCPASVLAVSVFPPGAQAFYRAVAAP